MSEFIALPVGQGDAFYLKRDNLSILVDGGKNRRGFSAMFKNTTGESHADIVVCTHNDADHVNGIIGFLEDGLSCKEIWLPGTWLDALPGVLKSLPEVIEQVYEYLSEEDAITIEEMEDDISSEHSHSDEARRRRESFDTIIPEETRKFSWPREFSDALENAEDWSENNFINWAYHHYFAPIYYKKKAFSLIAAASKIRKIALLAYHNGITVRWFEFFPQMPNGGCTELRPLNSKQMTRVKPRANPRYIHYVALSASNKRSLVFLSPGDKTVPDVLFNADSDLAGIASVSLAPHSLVTAPHHGSDSNGAVYRLVESWAQANPSTFNWIRSDGAFRKRPCKAYLNARGRKFCTLCRPAPGGAQMLKQTVRFSAASPGVWAEASTVLSCSCK